MNDAIEQDISGTSIPTYIPTPKLKWYMSFVDNKYLRFFLPKAPNRFHRFMQRWLLGIYWEKADE